MDAFFHLTGSMGECYLMMDCRPGGFACPNPACVVWTCHSCFKASLSHLGVVCGKCKTTIPESRWYELFSIHFVNTVVRPQFAVDLFRRKEAEIPRYLEYAAAVKHNQPILVQIEECGSNAHRCRRETSEILNTLKRMPQVYAIRLKKAGYDAIKYRCATCGGDSLNYNGVCSGGCSSICMFCQRLTCIHTTVNRLCIKGLESKQNLYPVWMKNNGTMEEVRLIAKEVRARSEDVFRQYVECRDQRHVWDRRRAEQVKQLLPITRLQQPLLGTTARAPGAPRAARATTISATRCSTTDCRGFLDVQNTCPLCKVTFCGRCEAVDHTGKCDADLLATVRLIRESCRPCPKCGMGIHRISGCAQMFCTNGDCLTAFDYNTGEIVTDGVIHNPHYFDHLRRGGVHVAAVQGCHDGNVAIYELGLDTFPPRRMEFLRKFVETLNLARIRRTLRETFLKKALDDIVHYIIGSKVNSKNKIVPYTKEHYISSLQHASKVATFQTEYGYTLDTFRDVGNDLLRNYIAVSNQGPDAREKGADMLFQQAWSLIEITSTELKRISDQYKMKTGSFNGIVWAPDGIEYATDTPVVID